MKRQQASLDCMLTAGSLSLLLGTPYDIKLLETVTPAEALRLLQAYCEFLSTSGSAVCLILMLKNSYVNLLTVKKKVLAKGDFKTNVN